MFWRKTMLTALLAVTGLSFLAGRAEAGWFTRPYAGWRGVGWSQYGSGGQLAGGQVVGAVTFPGGGQQGGTLTAAQWQQLVAVQQQAPVYSAAQWQQLVAAQAQQPQSALARPGLPQRVNPLTAAQLRQQQRDARLGAALQQWQQQNAPPRPPADGK